MSYPTYAPTIGTALVERIDDELRNARRKFPGNKHMLAALTEEVGELAQALIDLHRNKPNVSPHDVLNEAVQVAAMAIRVAQEGDVDFSYECPEEKIRR